MKLKKTFALLIFLLTVFIVQNVSAQTDYSKVKVDDLSDAQIVELIGKAEAMGYDV